MAKLFPYWLMLAAVLSSAASAGQFDASNATCSAQRASTPPILLERLLLRMGHTRWFVNFVNLAMQTARSRSTSTITE